MENTFTLPVSNNFKVNSPLGMRGSRFHRGVDINTPSGTEVYSIADGYIYKIYHEQKEGKTNGFGLVVFIVHEIAGKMLVSSYSHLSGIPDNILKSADINLDNLPSTFGGAKKLNIPIKKGGLIGFSGGGIDDKYRGSSSGPHLHLEIKIIKSKDPENYFKHITNTNDSQDNYDSFILDPETILQPLGLGKVYILRNNET